jgi:predicted nucleic acid-binding protein
MTFADIPGGAAIFVDANTFVYAFVSDPRFGPACDQLLGRIDTRQIEGFTSAQVVAEMAHRLMTLEATTLLGRSPTGLANWLKRHPSEVRRLVRYRQAIDELAVIGVQALSVSGAQVSRAADVSRQYGLLTNDALIVAVMRDRGLTQLASNDADLTRSPASPGTSRSDRSDA